jgi:outer membrane protein OmpA-like peptidoglycan-associated protein
VVVTEQKIDLKQTMYFDTRMAVIKPLSFPLLDEVVQVLMVCPGIHVRIEGHTDNRGSDSFNLSLSQDRSDAVRTYLIDHGIAAERMVARGYGETMPIADNGAEKGRAQNRRVDFVITQR